LGQQLFWLFVAVAGFAAGFELATNFLGSQPDWIILLIAVLVGVLGALLAIFFRYLAVAVAGFFSGAYIGTTIMNAMDIQSPWIFWVWFIAGGIVGAALLLMVFDWALIGLSAVNGASMLTPLTGWTGTLQLLLFIALVVLGVAVQFYLWRDDDGNRRVVVRRRRVDTSA
jgi:hypothetical protein